MKDEIVSLLKKIFREIGMVGEITPSVTRPEDPTHGDYTTNVAMVLAKSFGKAQDKNPMEIAREIQEAIIKHQKASTSPLVEKVEIASPGFINLFLSKAKLINQVAQLLKENKPARTTPPGGVRHAKSEEKPQKQSGRKADRTLASTKRIATPRNLGEDFRINAAQGKFAEKRIMIEFADPNPFKEFHIGHLRNITLGESFSRLLEAVGHEVRRVNYQGDVGMHVAKALWGLWELKHQGVDISGRGKTVKEKVQLLGKGYSLGATMFEENDQDKVEIIELNKKIYRQDPTVVDLWKEGRQWSLDYFDTMYERLGTNFTRFYFESEVAPIGAAIVAAHISNGDRDGIFEESDGAVVFRGEKYGLHTRVFLSKEGYATYEAKDLALAPLKYSEYPYDLSIIMTGNEQSPYFAVMLAALKLIRPDLASKTKHIAFGMVRLTVGKMSSRTGNVITADWLIDQAKSRIYDIIDKNETKYSKALGEEIAEKASVAAVKYSMLKVTAASDIAFDLEKSVSFEGDSGPYLQYAYARCRSVLRKASQESRLSGGPPMRREERALARLIGYFPEIVVEAAENLSPNTLCTYLFQLAQAFNLLYAKHEILGNDLRLGLTHATANILKHGLYFLGIEVLEQM